jgi:hypothetical protein
LVKKEIIMNWIKPPWRDKSPDDEGEWPWVGDQFLAAVQVINNRTGKTYWEYTVLTWSESGLECDGESWSAWGEDDIEWIARIPNPS